MDRIVYSTGWQNDTSSSQHGESKQGNTVTIDYDQTLRLFLSQQEHIEFSPQRMLHMVNTWVRANAARVTSSKRLRITAPRKEAQCELTTKALNALSHLYYRNVEWWEEFPDASRVLDEDYVVVVSL